MSNSFKLVLFFSCLFQLGLCKYAQVSEFDYYKMPNLYELDNFDFCKMKGPPFQYCIVEMNVMPIDEKNVSEVWDIIQKVNEDPRSFRHHILYRGICLDSPNWENQNYSNSVKRMFDEQFYKDGLQVALVQNFCNKFDRKMDTMDLVGSGILVFIFLFVIAASIYDRIKSNQDALDDKPKSTIRTICACFSIPRNWRRLRSTNKSQDAMDLRHIQSIRFLTIMGVIIGHTCLNTFNIALYNPKYLEETYSKPLTMFLIHGNLLVQTFFLLSAFMLSFTFFKLMEKEKFQMKYIWIALISRYIRLSVCYAIIICFEVSAMYYLGSGPAWEKMVGTERNNCRNNGWSNLLYFNNYYRVDAQCMQIGWYLAVDTQLYVVALFILSLIWVMKKQIKLILGVSFLIAFLIPGIVTYVNDLPLTTPQFPDDLRTFFATNLSYRLIYTSGYSNAGCYMLGIIYGYIFYKYRGKYNLLQSRKIQTFWWIFSFGGPISVMHIAVLFYSGYSIPTIAAAIYQCLDKVIWGAGVGFLVIGISLKIGWFARSLLLWNPFVFLGRLTFSVYVVHLSYMKSQQGSRPLPFFVSDFTIFETVLSDAVIAFMLGLIVCLFIEMPMSAMQKLILKDGSDSKLTVMPTKMPLKQNMFESKMNLVVNGVSEPSPDNNTKL